MDETSEPGVGPEATDFKAPDNSMDVSAADRGEEIKVPENEALKPANKELLTTLEEEGPGVLDNKLKQMMENISQSLQKLGYKIKVLWEGDSAGSKARDYSFFGLDFGKNKAMFEEIVRIKTEEAKPLNESYNSIESTRSKLQELLQLESNLIALERQIRKINRSEQLGQPTVPAVKEQKLAAYQQLQSQIEVMYTSIESILQNTDTTGYNPEAVLSPGDFQQIKSETLKPYR